MGWTAFRSERMKSAAGAHWCWKLVPQIILTRHLIDVPAGSLCDCPTSLSGNALRAALLIPLGVFSRTGGKEMLKSVLMAGVALAVLGGTPALAQSTQTTT